VRSGGGGRKRSVTARGGLGLRYGSVQETAGCTLERYVDLERACRRGQHSRFFISTQPDLASNASRYPVLTLMPFGVRTLYRSSPDGLAGGPVAILFEIREFGDIARAVDDATTRVGVARRRAWVARRTRGKRERETSIPKAEEEEKEEEEGMDEGQRRQRTSTSTAAESKECTGHWERLEAVNTTSLIHLCRFPRRAKRRYRASQAESFRATYRGDYSLVRAHPSHR
jgi:hypothetical protein